MKPATFLAAACAPLAALAVWSLVELRSIDEQLAPRAIRGESVAVERGRAVVESLRVAVAELATADLLAPGSLTALADLPADSPLAPLNASWSRWSEAHGAIGEIVAAEQLASRNNAENMGAAVRQMEQVKAKLEATKHPETADLQTMLDGRIAALRERIGQREQVFQAASLLSEARQAFQSGRYEESEKLCGLWIEKYGESGDPPTRDKVRTLQRRSAFHAERERSSTRMKSLAEAAEQAAILGEFLNRFPDTPEWTATERSVLERCRQSQQELNEKALAAEHVRGAVADLAALKANLPPGLSPRLAAAAAILQKRPSSQSRPVIREAALQWLEEALPEKRLNEDPLIQEAEMKDHTIVRGFFRKVAAPGGGTGYKRYDTLEEFQRPSGDVGTFLAEKFVVLPGPSLLRRAAIQYNDARTRLVATPRRKALWTDLATLCRTLEGQLAAYRNKPGASREPFSFAAETKLLDETLADAGWKAVEKVWNP